MERLSYEIVAHIASYLPLDDAGSFALTCKAALAACSSRIDPDAYLVRTFRTPRYLLAAMTDYGCVLSGSRALEYFVPGSIEPDDSSDWDFLVPCIESSTLGMMDALEKCGVKWEDPVGSVLALTTPPIVVGASALVRVATVLRYVPEEFARSQRHAPTHEQRRLFAVLSELARVSSNSRAADDTLAIRVEVTQDAPTESPPSTPADQQQQQQQQEEQQKQQQREDDLSFAASITYPHPEHNDVLSVATRTTVYTFMLEQLPANSSGGGSEYYSPRGSTQQPVSLINGYIVPTAGSASRSRTSSRAQKVQLFQCHDSSGLNAATPLKYIINTYYATHVQCFISGWCSGHFFYDLTIQRLALAWGLAHGSDLAVEACVRKYRQRGFRFFAAYDMHNELDGYGHHFVHDILTRKRPRHWPYKYIKMKPPPELLFKEGYEALITALNSVVLEVDADAQEVIPVPCRRLCQDGDGAMVGGFDRLQKTIWEASECDDCQNTPPTDNDPGSAVRDVCRHGSGLGRFRYQSLYAFSWQLVTTYGGGRGRCFQLDATERILPGMPRTQCPPDMAAKFIDGRGRSWGPEAADNDVVVPVPRAPSLRDHYAAGVVSGRVPSSTTDNLKGVSPEAVVQACTPWHVRGKVRVGDLDRGGQDVGNDKDDDDAYIELKSREELWQYFKILLRVTPTACHETSCGPALDTVLPPQI